MTPTVQLVLDDGVKTPGVTIGESLTAEFETGLGGGQADRAWSEYARTLLDTASETLDIFDFAGRDIGAGVGLDALGQSLALAEIVGILIFNVGPGNLTVDTTLANGWTPLGDTHVLGPGAFLFRYEPADPALVVTDGASHLIDFTAGGGDAVYDVHILGRSA